jgi:hypothetical protein
MNIHRRMARGGHGLPKVSPESAMPYPSTPCRQATCKVGGLRPSSTPLDTPRCTAMIKPDVFDIEHKELSASPGRRPLFYEFIVRNRESDFFKIYSFCLSSVCFICYPEALQTAIHPKTRQRQKPIGALNSARIGEGA